jgi:hypothetical protein
VIGSTPVMKPSAIAGRLSSGNDRNVANDTNDGKYRNDEKYENDTK